MLATMFICSVNTVLFNADPLMRYDGYYVMADWLEIPNLRDQVHAVPHLPVPGKMPGLEVPLPSYMPRCTGTCSSSTRWPATCTWVVTFSILFFLNRS